SGERFATGCDGETHGGSCRGRAIESRGAVPEVAATAPGGGTGRIATIFRWTDRSPQDLAPRRNIAAWSGHGWRAPSGCPGVVGPVPRPVAMDAASLPALPSVVNRFMRLKLLLDLIHWPKPRIR